MKIAVTAVSGKLGAAIAKQLIRDLGADQVVGLARNPKKANLLGIEVRPGDYNKYEDLEKSLTGVDSLLLVSGMDKPEIRIEQHRNVIRAAKACGIRKMVYTSILGNPGVTAFSPIIESNRQTEEDIKNSGMEWVIGRNGLYIEPDLEYLDSYISSGTISNSACDGLCSYTSRSELAVAYSNMLRKDQHNGKTYNLIGEPITQMQLAKAINQVYGTRLTYKAMTADEFLKSRQAELGEFLGTIIGGIYDGIHKGEFYVLSDFRQATGRKHKPVLELIHEFKASH